MPTRATTKTAKTKAATTRAGGKLPKRAYHRDFTPGKGDPTKDPATWGAEFKMNRIPRPLWNSVKTKAKREGVSLRWLLLSYLQAWVNEKAA